MTGSLAIVMPVHDEAASIATVVAELGREVVERFPDAEVIAVDDGSTDETPALLSSLREAAPWLRVERSERRRGHGPSLRRGLDLAKGDWIFALDSDGQCVVADFWRLWAERGAADLVLGVRTPRRDPRHRLLLSRALALVASRLAGRTLRDPNVPFRLIRRTVWEDVRSFLPPDVLALPTLITVGAAVRGWRVVEVPVSHRTRAAGRSSLRAFRLASFGARGLVQLIRFRTTLRARGRRSSRSDS